MALATTKAVIEELKQAGEMAGAWVEIIKMAAKLKKRVEITYRKLDNPLEKSSRPVEPIAWEYGRKGIHVLTHSPLDENWRRFAVRNIIDVKLTAEDYESNLKVTIA